MYDTRIAAAAAYLTLNDPDYRSLISETLGIDNIPGITRTSLTADGDYDNDQDISFTNLQEWWYALGGRYNRFIKSITGN